MAVELASLSFLMPRPICAHINTHALAHNLNRARACAPQAKVWAVVKANAYGHRIELAYAGLRGADGFAVLDLDEAQRLRALGWRGPVLLLEGCFELRDLELCSRLNLWHTIHHETQIDMLAAHPTQHPHHVFLKLNSGMNRLGLSPQVYRTAWSRLSGLTQVDEITLSTHFADADGPTGIADQLAVFESVTHDLPGQRSLANSAALLRFGACPLVQADWVRPGIMIYGASPDYPTHTIADWHLKATLSLRARVIAVQSLQTGDRVGYGHTFIAPHPMRIAVVACGYADGYPRVIAPRTPVLVDDTPSHIVGRVSMDMVTVDITTLPRAGLGSEVTLWGCTASGQTLEIDEIARSAGTTAYELMCALATRVPAKNDTH
jgi:alanine racemase